MKIYFCFLIIPFSDKLLAFDVCAYNSTLSTNQYEPALFLAHNRLEEQATFVNFDPDRSEYFSAEDLDRIESYRPCFHIIAAAEKRKDATSNFTNETLWCMVAAIIGEFVRVG